MARLWHTAGAHFRVGNVDMAMLGQTCHTARAHVRVDRVGILGGWWCMARLGLIITQLGLTSRSGWVLVW